MFLSRENAVFLMIDIQEKLLPAINGHTKVLGNALKLLCMVKALNIPLVYTEQYPKGIGATVSPLVIPEWSKKYEKTAFSCLDEPSFAEEFDMNDTVAVVFGIESHICVLSTVIDLIDRGKRVVMVADACGSRCHCNHSLAVDAARSYGALVLPTETVIYRIIRKAGTPEFKAMLPLMK